jgi:hypothetical protein
VIPLIEQETALVIEHNTRVFHISSTRVAMMVNLRKLAEKHSLVLDDPSDEDCVSLTNVPTKYLTEVSLSRLTNRS